MKRAVNHPSNNVGKQRQTLYTAGTNQIEKALEAGFALEAITLCESMLADRLESRMAWKAKQDPKKRKFSTLGRLAKQLGNDESESGDARAIYAEVVDWAARRNTALHEMFKLEEGKTADWGKRYETHLKTAREGKKLAREVSNLVRRLNSLIK